MSKKNSGINDHDDASGEQSHVDGNSGISNRIDGKTLPEPPTEISRQQSEEDERHAKMPTKRKSDIL